MNRDRTSFQQIVDEDSPQVIYPTWTPRTAEILYTQIDTKADVYPIESVFKFFQQGVSFCKQPLFAGDGFPNYDWAANPATVRFPVKREEMNLNEKESPL